MLDSLFQKFDNLIVLDTETTGINPAKEEIIELAAVRLVQQNGQLRYAEEFDDLIRLSDGRHLSTEIVNLTGITEQMLMTQGVSKLEACQHLMQILRGGRPLIVAYNAQFDLCFLYYFLRRYGDPSVLKGIKMLDALTIFKDRRPYPHKLSNAVDAYSLQTQNTHRAVDDAKATVELLCAMQEEEDDLDRYINLFGYNPKFGVPKPRIGSIEYVPQPYNSFHKLYEGLAPERISYE
ncbi:MAG: 3'-5' exonuclease [Ruminococcaceae bacterium]|nr:3'-5' exonuclease [Oscillospiraceae bacterium]